MTPLLCLLLWLPEIGFGITGTHLHKIDETPVGVYGRFFLNFSRSIALDAEAAKYSGKTSVLAGVKVGKRFDRFGAFGKVRAGIWHFDREHFSSDIGGVLEYYPSRHTRIRIDVGDTILFYGGTALGTVHNFQPGIGFGYAF
jgi:hypothetical protein